MAARDDKHIGRRAFIGLVLAGIAALFLGKEVLPRVSTSAGGGSPGKAGGFRINTVRPGQPFDEATWKLTVDGLVRNPLALTFSQLKNLPQVEYVRDFYCVEGWGVSDVTWRGVALSEIMARADLDPAVTHLVLHSSDGVYTDSLTLEEARRSDTLLAYELGGEPLRPEMGQPLRLVLPGNYGYKYVKWVVRVEAIAAGEKGYSGYWEKRGYPADATIR